ncbi:hypothetical protein Zmor_013115 [Zophobas morio]|uniref:Uncharacterized protein n=1 Tax=Zophobas morio TaxID=2755281 RepID=A0AA38MEW0_9CUCU|nr:hypothetical protein Zmor_013115 [Zophobas morio]
MKVRKHRHGGFNKCPTVENGTGAEGEGAFLLRGAFSGFGLDEVVARLAAKCGGELEKERRGFGRGQKRYSNQKTLKLAPYFRDFSPIELTWSDLEGSMQQPRQKWQKCIEHVRKVEMTFMETPHKTL